MAAKMRNGRSFQSGEDQGIEIHTMLALETSGYDQEWEQALVELRKLDRLLSQVAERVAPSPAAPRTGKREDTAHRTHVR